jgi:hypothetical protein
VAPSSQLTVNDQRFVQPAHNSQINHSLPSESEEEMFPGAFEENATGANDDLRDDLSHASGNLYNYISDNDFDDNSDDTQPREQNDHIDPDIGITGWVTTGCLMEFEDLNGAHQQAWLTARSRARDSVEGQSSPQGAPLRAPGPAPQWFDLEPP